MSTAISILKTLISQKEKAFEAMPTYELAEEIGQLKIVLFGLQRGSELLDDYSQILTSHSN